MTRLDGKMPSEDIKAKVSKQNLSIVVSGCLLCLRKQKRPLDVGAYYYFQPGKLEGGCHHANDPVWLLDIY